MRSNYSPQRRKERQGLVIFLFSGEKPENKKTLLEYRREIAAFEAEALKLNQFEQVLNLSATKFDERNVVFLSIIGGSDIADDCDAEPAPRIASFTEMFTHGSTGSICAGSYAEYFED